MVFRSELKDDRAGEGWSDPSPVVGYCTEPLFSKKTAALSLASSMLALL